MKTAKTVLSTVLLLLSFGQMQIGIFWDSSITNPVLHALQEGEFLTCAVLFIAGAVGLCTIDSPVGTIIDSAICILAGVLGIIAKAGFLVPFVLLAFTTGIAFLVMGIISLVRKKKLSKK